MGFDLLLVTSSAVIFCTILVLMVVQRFSSDDKRAVEACLKLALEITLGSLALLISIAATHLSQVATGYQFGDALLQVGLGLAVIGVATIAGLPPLCLGRADMIEAMPWWIGIASDLFLKVIAALQMYLIFASSVFDAGQLASILVPIAAVASLAGWGLATVQSSIKRITSYAISAGYSWVAFVWICSPEVIPISWLSLSAVVFFVGIGVMALILHRGKRQGSPELHLRDLHLLWENGAVGFLLLTVGMCFVAGMPVFIRILGTSALYGRGSAGVLFVSSIWILILAQMMAACAAAKCGVRFFNYKPSGK